MAEPKGLDNYVEVHERIQAFYERYPEGTLRCGKWYIREVGEQTFLVYQALAYRTPRDRCPGEGWAWEPYPGKTPFTAGSELMVAETSAWGRALASLGFEVHRAVASANEVKAREGARRQSGSTHGFASDKQKRLFTDLLKRRGAAEEDRDNIIMYAEAVLTGGREGQISRAIDALMGEDEGKQRKTLAYLAEEAKAWREKQSDLPQPDLEGLPDKVGDETVPGDAEKVAF